MLRRLQYDAGKAGKIVNISIVVAAAENNIIGINNTLPWRLPEDLKYFKALTMGHPMIMGRKTYESIGRPLPGRLSIVVTRQSAWHAEGVSIANSLVNAVELAEAYCVKKQKQEIMIVGGAEIYRQALPLCQKIYLTEIHAKVQGDAYFPQLNEVEWREINREDHRDIEGHSHNFSFITKQRICEAREN